MKKLTTGLGNLFAIGALLGSVACENLPDDELLRIDATGKVAGLAYRDLNGTGAYEPLIDLPIEDLVVRLVLGSGEVFATATTDAAGLYLLDAVPVGTFRIEVDPGFVGDSLLVSELNAGAFALVANDSLNVRIGLTYPVLTVAEARSTLPGKKGFIDAVALNASAAYSDTTVHVADTSGFIRATQVGGASILAGDSVRILGITARRDGQPAFRATIAFVVQQGVGLPPAEVVTSRVAATADGGRLDAALVRMRDVVVTDTVSVVGGLSVTVDDGSGPVELFLDGRTTFNLSNIDIDRVIAEANGLLVPVGGQNRWQVRPRSPLDLIVF